MVSSTSLTRIEAEQRADLLEVDRYRIALDLTGTDGFRSSTSIDFRCRTEGAATFLDVKAVEVESVSLNGAPLDPRTIAGGRLELTGLARNNELQIVARMAYSSDGEGLHRHVDPADGRTYLYAMSFLDAGPRWFACFDQPDLKARFDISVDAPEDWVVIGNGAASRDRTRPGRWTLSSTQPLATYFVTLVAGPYHSVRTEHDGIVLGVHARASLAAELEAEAPEILSVTQRAFDRYHALFGVRYPFGEYHQAFVPDFNAGAMENPGCVTLRDQFVFRSAATRGERGVRANTIVHELAHMWFDDLVTMRWWDDLWLNESFAEYMAHRVCSEVTDYASWAEFGITRKSWGYQADQAPSTHPVAGNGSADAASALADFDGISYAKGASALRQLAAFLGDEIFFDGLRLYFDRHAYSNAEFADLMAAWTEAGAVGLTDWAEQWLRTSGLDTITGYPTGDGLRVRLDSPDASTRPHAVHVMGFHAAGAAVFRTPLTVTAAGAEMATAAPLALVLADGADETWAKLRFGAPGDPSNGWDAVEAVLPRVTEPLSRVAILNAVRDAVRDAALDPGAALRIVLAAVAVEDEDLVVADLLNFATLHLAAEYAAGSLRSERLAHIASAASTLLDSATPGSDRQLVAGRALIAASSDTALLGGWLEDLGVPAGLVVDAELRWAIIGRLAELGSVDGSRIDTELAADRSSSGVGHAARARAARPDPEAKQAAWRVLTEPGDTPAYELYATATGFFVPGQEQVTAGYVDRFFTDLPDTASFRQGWALARTVLLGYPVSSADARTLALAEQTLSRGDLDSGVRRSMVDGTDSLRRAVASRQRFGPPRGSGTDGIGSAP